MTVSLMVKYKNDRYKSEFFPVSGQEFFQTAWKPLSHRLGLSLLPLMDCGVPLGTDEYPNIIHEFKAIIRATSNESDPIAKAINERALELVCFLESLPEKNTIEYFDFG